MTAQMIRHAAHEPPGNELPVALATPDLVSRGDDIALAIPSLLVYSMGIELLILGRYRHARTVDPAEDRQAAANRFTESARERAEQLPRLVTVNGRPVELLGGQGNEHGFTDRAWARFHPEVARTDFVVSLSWPGAPTTTRTVDADAIADAVRRVLATRWWPPG
jgi:hypothetical protein